ncbi:MAG: hypothetical protein II811_04710 [Spirochaetaceae bacterium]|nr:hypothetical protein [Spirochaetaceae bacterium]
MATSFAQKLTAARLMTAGLKSHADDVKKVGFDEAKIAEIEKLSLEAQELDNEQESLKAKLKSCTEKLNKTTEALDVALNDAKKTVKFAISQSEWKAFGISDKK